MVMMVMVVREWGVSESSQTDLEPCSSLVFGPWVPTPFDCHRFTMCINCTPMRRTTLHLQKACHQSKRNFQQCLYWYKSAPLVKFSILHCVDTTVRHQSTFQQCLSWSKSVPSNKTFCNSACIDAEVSPIKNISMLHCVDTRLCHQTKHFAIAPVFIQNRAISQKPFPYCTALTQKFAIKQKPFPYCTALTQKKYAINQNHFHTAFRWLAKTFHNACTDTK